MSPWIRRALVAGGFGIGKSNSTAPREIFAITSNRDENISDDTPNPSSEDKEDKDLDTGDIKVQVREAERELTSRIGRLCYLKKHRSSIPIWHLLVELLRVTWRVLKFSHPRCKKRVIAVIKCEDAGVSRVLLVFKRS
jgi:hypothetical protein